MKFSRSILSPMHTGSLALLLCLALAVQPLHGVLILLNYQLNKDFIAEFLCINRDKPKLRCEGKCQINKQSNESEEKQSPAQTIKEQELHPFLQTYWHDLFSPLRECGFVVLRHLTAESLATHSIFHPPRA